MQNNKPIWLSKPNDKVSPNNKVSIFVATPCHSECSIHYTQSLLKFQQACFARGIMVSFSLLKSSLVTQGRNLSVSNFLEECDKHPYTHFLFVDSDIEFQAETIFSMIDKDKEVIAAPYVLKTIDWNKVNKRKKEGMTPEDLSRLGFTWPIKLEGKTEIEVKEGVAEVTHVPTGCLLIKKQVFEKMIKAYPNLEITQPTIINGKEVPRPYFYNFFDTYHEPETKRYYGEDFGFCKRWTAIGGKCHLYVLDDVVHVGEYQFRGKLIDDLTLNLKKIDDKDKIK